MKEIIALIITAAASSIISVYYLAQDDMLKAIYFLIIAKTVMEAGREMR